MENLVESVAKLQNHLSASSVSSAVIGGLAVSVWGDPRVTRDTDLKVLLTRKDAAHLLEILPTDFVSLHDDPVRALEQNGLLFVRDSQGTRLEKTREQLAGLVREVRVHTVQQ